MHLHSRFSVSSDPATGERTVVCAECGEIGSQRPTKVHEHFAEHRWDWPDGSAFEQCVCGHTRSKPGGETMMVAGHRAMRGFRFWTPWTAPK